MSTPKPPSDSPLVPPVMQIGKPGDTYLCIVIPANTSDLQILADGAKSDAEYSLMLLAALNTMLVRISETLSTNKSPIIDPYKGLRGINRG